MVERIEYSWPPSEMLRVMLSKSAVRIRCSQRQVQVDLVEIFIPTCNPDAQYGFVGKIDTGEKVYGIVWDDGSGFLYRWPYEVAGG